MTDKCQLSATQTRMYVVCNQFSETCSNGTGLSIVWCCLEAFLDSEPVSLMEHVDNVKKAMLSAWLSARIPAVEVYPGGGYDVLPALRS
jgi:hypothetical protein